MTVAPAKPSDESGPEMVAVSLDVLPPARSMELELSVTPHSVIVTFHVFVYVVLFLPSVTVVLAVRVSVVEPVAFLAVTTFFAPLERFSVA